MSKKEKIFHMGFWICAVIIWLVVSAFFVNRVIDPILEAILRAIFKAKFTPIGTLLELLETVIMTFVGVMATKYFEMLTRRNLKEIHKELLEELGRDSSDNPYHAYHTILIHTQEMKNLVNKLVSLPRHPEIMRVLIEDYSRKANESKFLVDFPTFLKLAEILIDNCNEMWFVNTTPPYEWRDPIRFERNEQIKQAIEKYKNKIESKIKEQAIVKRITIVDDEKALKSILEHGIEVYFHSLGTAMTSDIDDEAAYPIVSWMQAVLRRYDQNLSKEYGNIYNIVEKPLPYSQKWKKLADECCLEGVSSSHSSFQQLSRRISLSVIKDFASLHMPPYEGHYIVKKKVTDRNKDNLKKLAKEEGIFIDTSKNKYLLRIEEQNAMNVLLVTVKVINDEEINNTNYNKLQREFLHNAQESFAIGKIIELINCLSGPC